jgi:ribosome biogenesis GTPase
LKQHRKRKQAGRSAVPGRRSGWQEDDAPSKERVLRGPANAAANPEAPSAKELDADTRLGRVLEIRGSDLIVEPAGGGEPLAARMRKSTRVPHSHATAVAVGDEVRFLTEASSSVLTEVLPRRTHLTRMRRGHQEHVICANVDLGVVVASAAQPPFKPGLVDRVLLSFRQGDIEPLLALNKRDLAPERDVEAALAPYREIGVHAVAVSASTGAGLEELEELLAGRTAVFAGQSGVGKSSLLNRLAGLDLRVADVYGRLGKGRHTTSASTMHRLRSGGAVIDTPGVRSFALPEPSPGALREFFPEVFAAAEGCRFADCRHRGDGGCALPAAVADGRVRVARLESFLTLTGDADDD